MTQTININQFAQLPLKGALDLAITNSKVLTGIVSASQATALVPGQRVKLDTTAQYFIPSVIAAGDNEAAIGVVVYNSRNSANLVAGQPVEVALSGGTVMWMEAAEAFAAQSVVYQTGVTVDTTSASHKKVGIAIDGAAATGDLVRVIIIEPQSLGA
jgi:hypothetical protein